MVIDVAKGIEDQTLKLFEVCKSRSIPIITFINKCDRPGQDPLELLDEIESRLGLSTYAATLPVGNGPDFVGIYDRLSSRFHHFQKAAGGRFRAPVEIRGLDDPELNGIVPAKVLDHTAEVDAILGEAGSVLDEEAVRCGQLSPVFFGSAVNNFGVQLLLDGFLRFASPPRPRAALDGPVAPERDDFSAFVFKIQANMDPHHRDRLIFLRLCSGRFERDLQVKHVQAGKTIRLSHSHQVFGRERDTSEEAWPGDIIGITGKTGLEIGDTLTTANDIHYHPIPRFAPECFVRLRNSDTNAFKRFRRGIDQLLQEKVVQQFFQPEIESREPLLGAVGPLQFDVVKFRLESEYNVDATIEHLPWTVTRWLDPEITEEDLRARSLYGGIIVMDDQQRLCLLFDTEWSMHYFSRQNATLKLHKLPPGSSPEFSAD
jgi:peptide chain release factor 3